MKCIAILSLLFLLGCQSGPKKLSNYGNTGLNGEAKVQLVFNPQINKQDRLQYFSYSDTKSFEDGDIRHQREQVVTFELAQVVKDVDLKAKKFTVLESTIKKDGLLNLNLFGLPDLGEAFDRVYDFQGHILSAGAYSKDSFFMVPYLVLPKTPVSVGDTWEMSKSWKTGATPFTVRAVFILKGFFDCGKNDRCADIEVSADVTPKLPNKDSKYNVIHQGRVLVALKRGSVVWGTFKADEQLTLNKSHQKIKSCIRFVLSKPEEFSWSKEKPECSPLDQDVLNPKGLPQINFERSEV